MIMPLFSATAILTLLTASGITDVLCGGFEKELFPINIQLGDDWSATKWTFLMSKNIARYVKNIMDCNSNTDVSRSLGDTELSLKLSLRTAKLWITLEEISRRARQKQSLWKLLRRWNERPHTEIGPGAFKDAVPQFDNEALGKGMKKLAALKKRQEDWIKNG